MATINAGASFLDKNRKLALAVLFLMAIGLIFNRINTFKPEKKIESQSQGAKIYFEPSLKSYKKGEEFEVKIILDTGNFETDAADVRFGFNPQVLAVQKIIPGTIYDDYPAKRTDLEKEIIIINGITSLSKTFKGKGVFTTVVFKGLKPGKANLIFEFTPDSTTDSNVVATKIAKDVLEEVEGASIEIN